MKKQTNQRRQSLLLASIAAIFLCGAFSSTFAQAGIGAKYGARDPRTCKDRTQPKGSAISADKAKEYFLCSEYTSGQNLYLYDEVTVQVGKARPYNRNEDINMPNIDTTVPVTPIRGSLKLYQCSLVSDYMENRGKNCFVYDHPNAKGSCYKDSFAAWNCTMTDVDSQLVSKGVPPPGGASQPKTPAVRKTGQNNQPPNDARQAATNTAAATQDANGYPKPDFSEMDKWYEITKFEYGAPVTAQEITFLFKPKVDHYSRAKARFEARYYDKDGALVGSYQVWVEYPTEVGEVGKGSAGTPSEKEMERVVSVKIVRLKD